ncbi:hypothetical protein SAMN05444920_13349 [Nonomuraea solani]|uniref:Uncharacterized protein n=1 Tax=Nonomuraea solani TaxID=1144553 RepID=A0A1H6F233_9ACTN|nr:hypothetical protein SAMN05444920_13349 [Nonomuraea solani]
MAYARVMVCVTRSPAASVTLARSETNPGAAGCAIRAVPPEPAWVSRTGRQFAPSSKDASSVIDVACGSEAPGLRWRRTGMTVVDPGLARLWSSRPLGA